MRRFARLGAVAGLLLVLTACLEDFERLTTKVHYDPTTRTLRVERVLHNVSAKFLGCSDAPACVDAAAAMARLDYGGDEPGMDFAALMSASDEERDALAKQMAMDMVGGGANQPTWQKLAKGLVDSAAFDVQVAYRRTGDQLDVVIDYSAAAESKAASDTGVIVEVSRKGKKETTYLVVDASKSVGGFTSDAPPQLVGVAKFVERTQFGSSPATWWVLPEGVDEVTVDRFVDEAAQPIFGEIAGLEAAMQQAGLLR